MLYPWTKNKKGGSQEKNQGHKAWTWKEHRTWCEKLWEEGPRKKKLREVKEKVQEVHKQWFRAGEGHRIPDLPEGREPQVIAEVYYMHHLPSAKGYVGMAYHGAHERMKTHWGRRNRAQDPSSKMKRTSEPPIEWIC